MDKQFLEAESVLFNNDFDDGEVCLISLPGGITVMQFSDDGGETFKANALLRTISPNPDGSHHFFRFEPDFSSAEGMLKSVQNAITQFKQHLHGR